MTTRGFFGAGWLIGLSCAIVLLFALGTTNKLDAGHDSVADSLVSSYLVVDHGTQLPEHGRIMPHHCASICPGLILPADSKAPIAVFFTSVFLFNLDDHYDDWSPPIDPFPPKGAVLA